MTRDLPAQKAEVLYLILDARAARDPDQATVLSACETLSEALEEKRSGVYGTCYVFVSDVLGEGVLGQMRRVDEDTDEP